MKWFVSRPDESSRPLDVSLVGLDDPSWIWAAHNGITGANIPWTVMAVRAGDFLVQGPGRVAVA